MLTAVNPTAPPTALIVYGGLEPLHFTNIFLEWERDETVTQLAMVVRNTSLFEDKLYLFVTGTV